MATNPRGVGFWAMVLIVVAIITGVGVYAIRLQQRGFDTRSQPSVVEAFLAKKSRSWAIPERARLLQNPMPASDEMLAHGRNHWADHCATCHANNGSGETQIGRNLYPKAPDMRLPETQSLSDGELYYIIRNGVRMTGMPAWGNPEAGELDHDTWMLVLFIRHLPQITTEEEQAMKALNPKTFAERAEEQKEEEFLNGVPSKEGMHDQ